MSGSSLGMSLWLSQLFVGAAHAAPDLHEPHAALEQPPGDQAVAAEAVGGSSFDAVVGERRGAFVGQVEHLRRAELHLRGQLVRRDARFEARIARVIGEMLGGSAAAAARARPFRSRA